MIFAEILSPEILIVGAIVVLLFGGSKIPQFARSLGSAKREFEKGSNGTAGDAPSSTAHSSEDI